MVGRTPWSAADAPVGLLALCMVLISLAQQRDEGVPRGPGGPPHHLPSQRRRSVFHGLCNDPEVLGPWVNARWLNVVAGFIISVLLLLSGTLMAGTLFPNVNSAQVAIWLAVVFAVGAAVAAAVIRIRWRRAGSPPKTTARAAVSRSEPASWRMPPIALLKPVVWAPATRLAMLVLRGYLVVSV